MEELFLKLVNMSISAGWLILAVAALRAALKKAPKALRCALWALVAFRLACPLSFESALSLIPSAETVPREILYAEEPMVHTGLAFVNHAVNPVISESLAPEAGDSVNPAQSVTIIASYVWLLGMAAMLVYSLVSWLRLRRRVRAAAPLRDNIWICDDVRSPFILGILRPRVCLPSDMDDGELVHVIAHERAHLARRDHWWKPLGFLLLTVYWFNPLVWLAYVLLCRDIELACDERVIKYLGIDDRKSYSEALLSCSVPHRLVAACPLAFGEVGVKQRIKTVLSYKKPAFWLIALAAAACVVLAVCFLTDPRADADDGLHAPEPFTHDYRVADTVFDYPPVSVTMDENNADYYSLSADYLLSSSPNPKTVSYEPPRVWTRLGAAEEIELTKDNFDRYFWNYAEGTGWFDGLSAAKLRRSTEKAWRVVDEDAKMYYILHQKDGGLYMTYGWYDAEGETDYYSDDSSIQWVFKMERIDLLSVTARSEGLNAYVEPAYYPVDFDFEYERLASGEVNGSGTLVFSPEWETDTLTVGEDYYTYPSENECVIEMTTYMLKKNADGNFELDVKRRGGVRDEKAVYYVLGETGKFVFDLFFPLDWEEPRTGAGSTASDTVDAEVIAGEVYVPHQCLYMTPLSSSLSFGGDNGYYYVVADSSFSVVYRGSSTGATYNTDWDWQEFPYTDEEWSELLEPFGADYRISELFDELSYLKLVERHRFLVKADGELWYCELSSHPNGDQYMWSIHSLIPASEMGSAEWALQVSLSSRLSAFRFEFDMDYTLISAVCTETELIDFDAGADAPHGVSLAFPAGRAVYWSPFGGGPIYRDEAEISFSVQNGDEMVCAGTIYIEAVGSVTQQDTQLYRAALVGTGLVMSQSEDGSGAVISLRQT